jgi:AraC family transcriptional regulator
MDQRPPYLFPDGAQIGAANVVLRAQAKQHRVSNYAGPLSIKTVLSGRVGWMVDGRELVVDRSSFLVLSDGEKYSMDISVAKPVETCCVFFTHGFVERVALDTTSPVERALDDPERFAPPLPYLSALHSDRERALTTRVHTLAQRCGQALTPSAWEQDFLLLAAALLGLYEKIRSQAARVPALRQSTREELFRRLLRGRDYMHSCSSGPVSLADAARAACVSPFHFHRGFTQAFGETPHAYLTAFRLEHAREQLEAGSSVLDACLEAGFSSPSAFSRLFRAQYGEAPSATRHKFARSGRKPER